MGLHRDLLSVLGCCDEDTETLGLLRSRELSEESRVCTALGGE